MSVILITAAANAEAYRLERILNASEVIFADHQELPKFSKSSHKFITIPKGDSPSFAHELLTICLDLQIEKVYPLFKDEIMALSEASILFEEYGIKVMIPQATWLKEHLHDELAESPGPIVILENGNIIAGSLSEIPVLTEELTGIFNWTCESKSTQFTLFTINNANIR